MTDEMQLFVAPINSNSSTRVYHVTPATTGLDLKQLIIDRDGGDLQSMRLIWAGRDIHECDTIHSRGIKPDSTIHVVLRMLSCSGTCQTCLENPLPNVVKPVYTIIENNNNLTN